MRDAPDTSRRQNVEAPVPPPPQLQSTLALTSIPLPQPTDSLEYLRPALTDYQRLSTPCLPHGAELRIPTNCRTTTGWMNSTPSYERCAVYAELMCVSCSIPAHTAWAGHYRHIRGCREAELIARQRCKSLLDATPATSADVLRLAGYVCILWRISRPVFPASRASVWADCGRCE